MPYKCCVPGCKGNYDKGPKVHCFSFPADEEGKTKWLRAICRKDYKPSKHSRVCHCHFEPHFIRWISSAFDEKTGRTISCTLQRPTLLEGVVPSIFPNCSSYLLHSSVKPRKSCDQKENLTETNAKKRGRKRSASTKQEKKKLKENAVVQAGRPKQLIEEADTDVVLKKEDEVDTASDTDINQEPNLRIETVKTEAEDDLDENSRLSSDPSALEEEKVEIKTEPLEEDEDAPALVTPTGLVISQQYVHNLEQQVQVLQSRLESKDSEIFKLKSRNLALLQMMIEFTKVAKKEIPKELELKERYSQTLPVVTSNIADVNTS